MAVQRSRGGSRKTARPTPNPIRPSTPITTRGKPMWMATSVRLSRIPSKVTQPLQPRPRVIRLRIATTLLGPVGSAVGLAHPPLEERALGRIVGQVPGTTQGQAGVGVAAEIAEHLGSGRMKAVIAVERLGETIDVGQGLRGPV